MVDFFKFLLEMKEYMWTVVGLMGILFIFLSLLEAHLSGKYIKFSLLDAFSTNGLFSGSKTRLNLAFVVSSWVLILVATKITTITNDFVLLFGAYLSAWVIDRMDSRKKPILPNLEGSGKIEEDKH